jgi:hypothetical protein
MCLTAWVWASLRPQFLPRGLWFNGVCTGFVMIIPLFMRREDATACRTIDASPGYMVVGASLALVTYGRLGAGIAYPWAALVVSWIG